MKDEIRRVGLVFTEQGAVDFKKSLQEINLEMNKNYNQFKLTQAQWDKSTSSTQKLRAEQEYLQNAYSIQTDKVNTLKMQLEELEKSENKNSTAIKKKRNELTSAQIKLETYNSKLKDIELQLNNTGKKLEEFGTKIEKNGEKIEKAGSKMSAFSAATGAALVASTKSAIDFEDAFTGVEKTVDGTAEQMEELKQGIRDMAKEMPSTTTEISAVAEAAGQLGIKTENILSFSKAMIDLGNSTNLTADEAASQLAKFANIMQMSQTDFDKLGSSIVDLGNHFATTEADIVAMAMRLAGAGKQVGLSEGQVLGLATALSSVGIEAEMGGSAISKAMVKMQNAVDLGGGKLQTVLKQTGTTLRELELMAANDSMSFKFFADSIGMTSTELKQLITAGANLEDFSKISGMTAEQFKKAWKQDAAGALSAFIKGLGDAESKGESAISMLSEMGLTEVRLRDSLLRAANAGNLFTDAIKTGTEAWEDNTALTNEANKRYNTLKSKTQIAMNKFKDLSLTLGNKLTPTFEKVIDKIEDCTEWVENLTDEQVELILKIGLTVTALGPFLKIMGNVTTTTGKVVKGIGTFTQAVGVMNGKVTSSSDAVNGLAGFLTKLTSPTGAAVAATIALTGVVIAANKQINEETNQIKEKNKQIQEEIKAIEELHAQQQESLNVNLSEIANVERLREELTKLVDENGKVKEGYEGRVKFILGELNDALGTEYQMTGNVINQYSELSKNIDNVIAKKKASIILDSKEAEYAKAVNETANAEKALSAYMDEVLTKKQQIAEWEEKASKASDSGGIYSDKQKALNYINNTLKPQLKAAQKNYDDQEKVVKTYYKNIADYEKTATLIQEGTAEAIKEVNDSVTYSYMKNADESTAALKEAISIAITSMKTYEEVYAETQSEITKSQKDGTKERLNTLVQELVKQTSAVQENSPDVINAWKYLAQNSYSTYYDKVSELPIELSNKIQQMTGVTLERTPELVSATEQMSQQVLDELKNNAEYRKEAINNLKGFLNGLNDEELLELLRAAGVNDAQKVMQGIRSGNLAEDEGINILQSLKNGLNNTSWKNSLWNSARKIASTLSGLLSVKASVNGNTSAIPGHKLGLDYVPKDNYLARLHKGERVLTKEENEEYSEAEENTKRSGNVMNVVNYDKIATAISSAIATSNARLENLLIKIAEKKSYIILDTGILVGETAEQIDTALGDLSNKQERGG